MTTQPSPAYRSQPVILVHLVASADSNIAWCAQEVYWPDRGDQYPGVPRQMCPACAKAPYQYDAMAVKNQPYAEGKVVCAVPDCPYCKDNFVHP